MALPDTGDMFPGLTTHRQARVSFQVPSTATSVSFAPTAALGSTLIRLASQFA